MRVKFRMSVAGHKFGFASGREVDLDDDFALGFVKAGLADPVEDRVIEAAVAPEAERVAVLPSPKRAKKR
jgi:hypothetical protein